MLEYNISNIRQFRIKRLIMNYPALIYSHHCHQMKSIITLYNRNKHVRKYNNDIE